MRTLSSNLSKHADEKVLVMGRVYAIRKLGSINFIIIQDKQGIMQCAVENANSLPKIGSIVEIEGIAKSEERAPQGMEVRLETLNIISEPIEDLPFDISKKELNLQLSTLLDYRTLTLRHEKVKAIFKIYSTITRAYGEIMRDLGFMEIKTPKTVSAAAEGGANLFKIKYFEKSAYLAQSPQFYKQICVGAFENVFEIGPVFRAEKHFTTRHVNEYISLDAEMAYIKDFTDITKTLTKVIAYVFGEIEKNNQKELKMHNAEINIPKEIPSARLSEVRKIVKGKYHYQIPEDTDIDPEGERLASRYAKEEFNSDFLFITHYPTSDRPFYTMPNKQDPSVTDGFDLIYKGLEITTGSQRIHDYKQLVESMKKKGLNPEDFEFYLQTFKYAMPPHGGWGMGSERIVFKLLDLETIKEAILFPRDVKRLIP